MSFFNRILKLTSYITSIFNTGKKFNIPDEYELVYSDNFDKINFDYWREENHDGEFKTGDLKVYWNGIDAITTHDNIMEMSVKYKPKTFNTDKIEKWQRDELGVAFGDNKDIEIPFVCGFLKSRDAYRYGIFSVETIMPQGDILSPAFWLCGVESWPPEIDIFEGYCAKDTIEPNVHYGETNNYTGASSIAMRHKYDKWHETLCWWEKDFIKIYYDGNLVYSVTDPEILKWFNNRTQNIILNCNIEQWEEGWIPVQPTKSPLKLRNFRVYQKY